jgi:starch synthase
VGFVGRLTGQKGIDLLERVGGWLAHGGRAQLAILGTGEARYERALARLQRRWPGRVSARLAFNNGLAHRITAGSDLLVMPSRFEPCGLNQLYALAYGTVPVVHATGGLADTVPSFNPTTNEGMGWAFAPASVDAFQKALHFAITTWHHHPSSFRQIALRGMAPDRGWARSAGAYAEVLST